jgi:3-deoxy-D-manno-octulosonic-acid transferase
VGEVGVAAALARGLPEGEPQLVTTVTPTGQERARAAFPGASVAYLPFDLGPPVTRFYGRFRPRALVLVEGDYWPLVLRGAVRRDLPVAVVNGRVGDRSFRRMRRLRPLLGPLLGRVARFGVQSDADAERLRALGVPAERVRVTGNLKYESPEPPPLPDLEAMLAALAAGRPVLVAGSTMGKEEEKVLAAFRAAGGGRRALLVLAPRHDNRWDEVAALLAREEGLSWVRRSALPGAAGPSEGGGGRPDVLLLDSLGELASLYRRAAGAFIGGTLVPSGGHNPLEAARWGVPVAVGPSMENFREMAADFGRRDAWAQVPGPAELGEVFGGWLDDPAAARALGARGRELVEANRGALARTLELLEPIVGSARPTPREPAP